MEIFAIMANSKKVCLNCRDYYRTKDGQPRYKRCCSDKCELEFGIKEVNKLKEKRYEQIKKAKIKKLKEKDKEYKIKKREFKKTNVKTRAKAAKLACHAYIKERDKGRPCICCNRSTAGKSIDSGHYLESGNHPYIRFHPDNIHSQLVYCNRYQGGDSDDYRGNLIKKIGIKRVLWLESNKSNNIKRTAEDYMSIEQYFKVKIRELKNERRE